jgi:hypothetical protein
MDDKNKFAIFYLARVKCKQGGLTKYYISEHSAGSYPSFNYRCLDIG